MSEQYVELPAGPTLCYRTDGPPDGEAVLLIAGLGQDYLGWPQQLVAGYVERGLRVIRFDNRDAGS